MWIPRALYLFERRLSAVMPGRPTELVGRTIREILGPQAHDSIAPALTQAYAESNHCEFTDEASARRIRGAFTPDNSGGVYILSMDVTEETQNETALSANPAARIRCTGYFRPCT